MVNIPISYKTFFKYYINRFLSYYFIDLSVFNRMTLLKNYIKFEILKNKKNKTVDFNQPIGNLHFKVINLPFRVDRKLNISNIMNVHNLNFEFFSAINGFNLKESDLGYITNRTKNNLSEGSIGCAISHIKLWEEIAQKNTEDFFIIFEDDIILPDDFKPRLFELIKQLPFDVDILFLGSGSTRGRDIKYFVNEKIFKSFNPRRGLYAYLLHPESAKKLITLVKPFDQLYGGIDTKIGKLTRKGLINVYHLYPNCVNVDTDIISNIYNFSLRNKKQVMAESEIYTIN